MSLIFPAAVVWLSAALFVTSQHGHPLAGPARIGLVLTGVPLLGWLTYAFGPLAGLLGLLVGVAFLLRCRLPRLTGGRRRGD